MPPTIAIERPRQPEIEALLGLSAEFAQSLYPPESNFLLGVDELERPGVSFYAARDESGSVQGIGALVPLGRGTAELKRMFVHPDVRGRGVAGLLLERIETDARAGGIRELRLETGPLHEAALALYRRHGYREVSQFGQYIGEEFSVCLAKAL
jgi:putative acetyltransferase